LVPKIPPVSSTKHAGVSSAGKLLTGAIRRKTILSCNAQENNKLVPSAENIQSVPSACQAREKKLACVMCGQRIQPMSKRGKHPTVPSAGK